MHDGYLQTFEIAGCLVALLQQDGVPAIVEGHCPHAGHPFRDSRIVGRELRCDMHGYLFDIRTGLCTYFTEGPCRALRIYQCEIHDGRVGVVL